jgi:FkbM family methyltransferase
MALRQEMTLAVDDRARNGFEYFCYRDLDMVRELDGFLAQRSGRLRLLDVGACHGLFSLAFTSGRAEAAALAVDPSPVAFEVLRSNLALNPRLRVLAAQAALGARPGIIPMRANWHHLEAVGDGEIAEDAQGVPVQTVDDLCARHDFRPDVLKIDVEGYELEVLRGAASTLALRPLIFLELHPKRIRTLGGSLEAIEGILHRHGYTILSGPSGRNRVALGHHLRATRVFCRPAALA